MRLLQNNPCPLTILGRREAITKGGWAVLPLTPYSPYLALYDCNRFEQLKDALRGTDSEGVVQEVKRWLHHQGKT